LTRLQRQRVSVDGAARIAYAESMAYTLITGASSGLGLEIARRAAANKQDLILVARRADRLQLLATELREQHGVTVQVMAADLSVANAASQLAQKLSAASLEVDTLINNAGVGSTGNFWQLDADAELSQVQVNVTAVVELTRLLLPAMVARGAGRILNIGSTAGFQPGPFMATYYATKAFVNSFSAALAEELKGTGVTVTVSCPGPIATEFSTVSGNGKNRLFTKSKVATAAEVASQAYAAMLRGDVMVIHGAKLKVAIFAARFAPRSVATKIAKAMNRP
jgi:uncharacterized protein